MCWHSWSRCEHCRASCPGPWWHSVPVMPLEPWMKPPQQFWQASRSPACEETSFPSPHFSCNKIHPPKPPGLSLELSTGDTGDGKVLEAAKQEKSRISLSSCGFELQAAHLGLRNSLQLWFRACLKQAVDIQRVPASWFQGLAALEGVTGLCASSAALRDTSSSSSHGPEVLLSVPVYL